jgi:hypothetical protein
MIDFREGNTSGICPLLTRIQARTHSEYYLRVYNIITIYIGLY